MAAIRYSLGEILDWLDLVQIALLLSACYACFSWGKVIGIQGTIDMFLFKKIITEKDLEKLTD